MIAAKFALAGVSYQTDFLAYFGVQLSGSEHFSLGMLYYYIYTGFLVYGQYIYVVMIEALVIIYILFGSDKDVKFRLFAMEFVLAIKKLRLFALAILIFICVPLSIKLGRWEGYKYHQEVIRSDRLPAVEVAFKDKSDVQISIDACQVNRDCRSTAKSIDIDEVDCLRQLFIDSKFVYLFPVYKDVLKAGITPSIYMLPLDDIASIKSIKTKPTCSPQI